MNKFTRVISIKDPELDGLCAYAGFPGGYSETEKAARADLPDLVNDWPINFVGIATQKGSQLSTDKNLIAHTRTYTAFIFLGQWSLRILQVYKNTKTGFFYVDSENLMAVSKSHKLFSVEDQKAMAASLLYGDDDVKLTVVKKAA